MLTKFDEQAQKAIVVGESIAFDLGHNNVGSEHLLLSLLKISDSKLRELVKKYDVGDKSPNYKNIGKPLLISRHLHVSYIFDDISRQFPLSQ